MSNLVERYLYQVGRYLPNAERADIQAELGSLIDDKLEDRGVDRSDNAEVTAVLQALGAPLQVAQSYGAEPYLVGPALYPTMMRVLRFGAWVAPMVVVVVNVVLALLGEQISLWALGLNILFGSLQALFMLFAITVGIFAIIQFTGVRIDEVFEEDDWDPADLPASDTGSQVTLDASWDLAGNIFALLLALYFLYAGGLTLRINLADPGAVLPSPGPWLALLAVSYALHIGLVLWVLRRGRWELMTRLAKATLELLSLWFVYHAIFVPVHPALLAALPFLQDVPMIGNPNAPLLVTLLVGAISLVGSFGNVVKLLRENSNGLPSLEMTSSSS